MEENITQNFVLAICMNMLKLLMLPQLANCSLSSSKRFHLTVLGKVEYLQVFNSYPLTNQSLESIRSMFKCFLMKIYLETNPIFISTLNQVDTPSIINSLFQFLDSLLLKQECGDSLALILNR